MEKSALALDKLVWFEKPSYDEAERLYFEKLAKVVSRKLAENCALKSDPPVVDNPKESGSKHKKSERSKDNKDNRSLLIENSPRIDQDDDRTKKQNKCAKDIKEEKNKADNRHRNRGKGKSASESSKNASEPNKETAEPKTKVSGKGTQQPATTPILPAGGSLANEVAKARQHIIQSLQCVDGIAAVAGVNAPGVDVKKESLDIINGLKEAIQKLEERVRTLEDAVFNPPPMIAICPAKPPEPTPPKATEKNDDELDLFDSDSEGEDAEAAKIREERLAAYAAKKAKKPALIAKSNIILDVKPWDDSTDMAVMEAEVRKIEMNGLLWGAAKLVPLAYGIHKLQISCVVEDDKVSVDELTEKIQDIEDYVQSVDIAAFNKI